MCSEPAQPDPLGFKARLSIASWFTEGRSAPLPCPFHPYVPEFFCWGSPLALEPTVLPSPWVESMEELTLSLPGSWSMTVHSVGLPWGDTDVCGPHHFPMRPSPRLDVSSCLANLSFFWLPFLPRAISSYCLCCFFGYLLNCYGLLLREPQSCSFSYWKIKLKIKLKGQKKCKYHDLRDQFLCVCVYLCLQFWPKMLP